MWEEGRHQVDEAAAVGTAADEEDYWRFDDALYAADETDLAADETDVAGGNEMDYGSEHMAGVDPAAGGAGAYEVGHPLTGGAGDDGYSAGSDGTSVWIDGLLERAIQAGSAEAEGNGTTSTRAEAPVPKRQGPVFKAMPPQSAFIYRQQAAAPPPVRDQPRDPASYAAGYGDVNRVALQQYRERGPILLNDEAADLVRLRGGASGRPLRPPPAPRSPPPQHPRRPPVARRQARPRSPTRMRSTWRARNRRDSRRRSRSPTRSRSGGRDRVRRRRAAHAGLSRGALMAAIAALMPRDGGSRRRRRD